MEENKLPEWLAKNDEYIPNKVNSRFIEKSILSLISILSAFRLQGTNVEKRKINPSIKMVFTFGMILFIAFQRTVTVLIVIDVALLVRISLLKADAIKRVIKSTLLASLFTVILLVPVLLFGHARTAVALIIKVTTSLVCVHIFSVTTKWNDITKSLRAFHVPDLFLFTLDLTLQYIVLLGELCVTMLTALKLRTFGKAKEKGKEQAHILGIVFIRSKQMSEEMYEAMICRGYTGEYSHVHKKEKKNDRAK